MQNIVNNKKNVTIAFLFSCTFMLSFSISGNIYGILLPRIIDFYKISLSDVSILNVVNDISSAFVTMFMLFVADRVNKRMLLTISAILYGVALLFFGSAPTFATLILTRVFIGTLGGLVNNILSAYVSDIYGDDRSRYLAVLHTLFAIGSLIGPAFSTISVSIGGWQLSYLILAVVFIISGSLFLVLSKSMKMSSLDANKSEKGKAEKIPYFDMLRNRNVQWLCAGNMSVAMVFFIMIWIPTYLDNLNSDIYSMGTISIMMTTYSIGMIISRMAYTYVSTKMKPATYLRYATLFSAIIMASIILINNVYIWIGGIFLYGMISGATYTANIILACKEYPKFSATITSLTALFTVLANMIFNTVIGNLSATGYETLAILLPPIVLSFGFIIYTFGYKEKVLETYEKQN